MIVENNFHKLLECLGFNKDNSKLWTKNFTNDCSLQVDFEKKLLIYPENKGLKVNERQTCNFASSENFVVFECVCRLLDKGYRPEHIELEPRWKLGHGAKSGRADIWIRTTGSDGTHKSLLIIECKTAGKEFDDAWADTQEDGAQLFSYFQQERATKFLCLYASDFVDNDVKNEYYLINAQDNDEFIATLKTPKTFTKAENNKQLFAAWKETYQQDAAKRGLFETDIAAYEIGKNKYSLADLVEVDNDAIQRKYHQFATILRQHNVSGHENAFDKLVNLFLAKVVDETNNPDELAFYWKGAAYDDAYRLQDRLQKLYKTGMEKFLNETVTYIENKDIEAAFRLFKNDPDETKKTILDYFRQLKFFTNNDFAFIDVHNENLFNQNSAVLKKIVQMLQDIRLKTETQNQFLGDLFEGFLDQGVKQSEGQFFTPMPIVKFLIGSLPLEKIIKESTEIPQAIDYACGAGHFLNEYAEQIKPFVKAHKADGLKNYYAAVTGIEKEYRLSKVAKVSAFMYGQDEVKIIYADALAAHDDIKNAKYAVLVANPPYSVKGFLETLTEEDRSRFTLAKEVSDLSKNNSIETFFVERAAQLLHGGGVAAIVLPSSILSNGNIYIKCREIILKYFDLVAIAEFGSGTFGKTGTNTATLFMRRKASAPDLALHYQNRVNAWFDNDHDKDRVFEDDHLLAKYCKHIGIAMDDYKTLLNHAMSETLKAHEIFKEYRKTFADDTRAKTIKKKKMTTKYTEADRTAELEKHILASMRTAEQEKLYYFLLAESNPQPVLIVKTPADTKAAKQFLGYEWSGAKGNEGIKYIGVNVADEEDSISQNKGIKQINTPLFNSNNLADAQKINSLIRANFEGSGVAIPEPLNDLVSLVSLTDMLDFSRVVFDKALRTSTVKKTEIQSKYALEKLGDKCDVRIGGTPARKNAAFFGGRNIWVSIAEMNGQVITDTKEKITDLGVEKSNVKLIPKGTTLLSFKLSIGKTAIAGVDLYTNEAIAGLIPFNKEEILDEYLFCLFNGKMIDLENVGNKAFGKSLNSTYLKEDVKIPLPPLAIQQQIVSECKVVDADYNKSRMSIEEYKQKIAKVFEELEVIIRAGGGNWLLLKDLCVYSTARIQYENTIAENYISTDNLLQNCEGMKTYEGLPNVDSVISYQEDDILVSNIRPYLKKIWLSDRQGGCSPDVLAFRVKNIEEHSPRFVYQAMKRNVFFDFMMQGVKGMKMPRGNKSSIMNFLIPVPPLEKQHEIVKEIESYEAKIREAQAIMAGCAVRKQEILQKYL